MFVCYIEQLSGYHAEQCLLLLCMLFLGLATLVESEDHQENPVNNAPKYK